MTATVMAAGTIGGPLVGGFITGHAGWRWAFYVNLPLGALALVWCWFLLRLPATRAKARVDWAGITLMTAVVCALVLATTWAGSTYPWTSWQVMALFAAAVAGAAAFVAVEHRTAEPLLPLRIFTGHRNFPLMSALILVSGVAMFGCALYLPLFQQTVQGASASDSGLLLLPLMAPVVVVSQIGGRVMSATGRYKAFPVIGTACMTAGLFLLSTMDASTSRTITGCYMALVGAGMGCLMQMVTTIAQNSVEMRDLGAASAAMTLFRTIGGSVGVAVFGSLFNRAFDGRLPSDGAGGASPAGLPPAAREAYLHAFVTGTHQVFLLGAVVCAVSLAAALLVKEVPLRGKPQPAPAAGGPGPEAAEAGRSAR
ncbi:MFS transporter [Actinomadura opuntiae]|uniref:MFS transporter n=1 Tax=Actinomadura sp. OS1-43 TaxID=604315 RepID=UPI003342C093